MNNIITYKTPKLKLPQEETVEPVEVVYPTEIRTQTGARTVVCNEYLTLLRDIKHLLTVLVVIKIICLITK